MKTILITGINGFIGGRSGEGSTSGQTYNLACGNLTGQFKPGTKYWSPMALFNYACGGKEQLVQQWKVYKVNRKAPLEIQEIRGHVQTNLGTTKKHLLRLVGCNESAIVHRNSCGSNTTGYALNVGSGSSWLDFSANQFAFRKTVYGAEGCWSNGTYTHVMYCNGCFEAYGDVVAYASDKRLKCNVLTISCAIDRIKAIRGVEFEWDRNYISSNNLTFDPSEKGKTLGFIAQELGKVIPTAEVEAPFEKNIDRKASWEEKYKTTKPEKVIPLLVEATKEQQCTIEKQQRQIDTLTCQVELLLKRCA